jgi:hypothetical protein
VVHARNISPLIGELNAYYNWHHWRHFCRRICGSVEVTLTLKITMQVQLIKQQIKHSTSTYSIRKIQSVCNVNKVLQKVENKS